MTITYGYQSYSISNINLNYY